MTIAIDLGHKATKQTKTVTASRILLTRPQTQYKQTGHWRSTKLCYPGFVLALFPKREWFDLE